MAMQTVAIKENEEMKICVTSEGKDLSSKVDPRFGRCRNFVIVDTKTGAFEALENTTAQSQGGAGIQSGQLMASKGVQAVLTGHVGPNAFGVLQAAGIEVITNISGTVSEVAEKFKADHLKPVKSSDVHSKFGVQMDNERKMSRRIVKVDLSKCDGCGQCAEVCPVEGIKVANGKASVNECCVACETCLTVCAKEALSMGMA